MSVQGKLNKAYIIFEWFRVNFQLICHRKDVDKKYDSRIESHRMN